jgi:mevalonate kinase
VLARAPAKLILSGEHAVLYGAPALALTVDCYAYTKIEWQDDDGVFFDLVNLNYSKKLSYEELFKKSPRHAMRVDPLFQSGLQYGKNAHFEKGGGGDSRGGFYLAIYTTSLFFNHYNITPTKGLKITINSDIPLGSGMGSSAAVILTILFSLANFFGLNISQEEYYLLAKKAEDLAHGTSSGLDIKLILEGGFNYFCDQKLIKRTINNLPFNLINTGAPLSTTKDCVMHAKKYFTNSNLVADFTAVTNALDDAILNNNLANIKLALRENHKLLVSLNVVSDKTLDLIEKFRSCRKLNSMVKY